MYRNEILNIVGIFIIIYISIGVLLFIVFCINRNIFSLIYKKIWIVVKILSIIYGFLSISYIIYSFNVNYTEGVIISTPIDLDVTSSPTYVIETVNPTSTISTIQTLTPQTTQFDGIWKGSTSGIEIDISIKDGAIDSVHFIFPNGISGPELVGNCSPEETQNWLGYESWINGLKQAVPINSNAVFNTNNPIPIRSDNHIRYLALSGRFNPDGTISINIYEDHPQNDNGCVYRTNLSAILYPQ